MIEKCSLDIYNKKSMVKKYSVKLNNNSKIEQLLQETYDLSCQQYRVIQEEMNKLSTSTTFKDLDIDGKEKYGKIMNNYIASQQKSIAQKYDIAKLMADVVKFSGDVKEALDNTKNNSTTLDLDKLRKLAIDASSNDSEEYKIKG